MIKAVMLDLDGTLLNNNHKISEENKEVLQKLRDKGVEIFLATGRSFNSMKPYYNELNLDTPAICYNGAKIVYPNGDFKEYPVEEKEVKELIKIAHQTNTHLNLYQDEIWYSEVIDNEEAISYKNLSGLVPHKKDFLNLDCYKSTKVLFVGEHEKLLSVENSIKEKLKDRVYVTFSKPYLLEILENNVNKGTTMERIMKDYNISLSEVVAFGDGLNDFEMLQLAGVGVAMENSFTKLKNIADKKTLSNEESGVAHFLKKYL